MNTVALFLILSATSVAQTPTVGGIKVQGACNQVISGANMQVTQVTLNCDGIDREKAAKLVRLLNVIIGHQLDPDEVYAQLNQISSKITSLNVAVSPLTGMPQQEQNLFLAAQRLYGDCVAASLDWKKVEVGALSASLQNATAANEAFADAESNVLSAEDAYRQNPSNKHLYDAYLKAKIDFVAAHTALQEAVKKGKTAIANFAASDSSHGTKSAEQIPLASYRNDLEPRLVKLRAQILALPANSAPILSPDYDTVSSAEELRAVCKDFERIGMNAYNSEAQRVRTDHAQPGQTNPQ